MRKGVFYFKQFACSHSNSSIKIGVDAVLIGAWADIEGARKILDVGTGCGVIALICAQRNRTAMVDGIDIHSQSIEEAKSNFDVSPWSERLKASLEEFGRKNNKKYDFIISNPPYFDSGINNPATPRLQARHQAGLSPLTLLSEGSLMLSDGGRIAMIVPADQKQTLIEEARKHSLFILRLCRVRGHRNAAVKRVMLEFGNIPPESPAEEELTLEISPNVPTEEYRELCHDLYLRF